MDLDRLRGTGSIWTSLIGEGQFRKTETKWNLTFD